MERSHRKVLETTLVTLTRDLDCLPLFPYMISKGVMRDEDRENVERFSTRRRSSEEFIAILKTRGPNAFRHFMDALKSLGIYQHLVEELERTLQREREREREKDLEDQETDGESGLTEEHAQALKEAFEDAGKNLPVRDLVHHLQKSNFLGQLQTESLLKKTSQRSMRKLLVFMLSELRDDKFQPLLATLEELPEFKPLSEKIRSIIGDVEVKEENMISRMRYSQIDPELKSLKDFINISGEVNVVLLGKTGSGKSSTGNTLMGETTFFDEVASMTTGTTEPKKGRCHKNDHTFNILDTPGLFDVQNMDNETSLYNIANVLLTFESGIHVFLLVCRCDVKFTQEEYATLAHILEYFGESIYKHTLLVFTRANNIPQTKSLAALIDEVGSLQDLVQKLSGRAIAVENHPEKGFPLNKDKQRDQVLISVADVVSCNNGKTFTNDMLKEIEKYREIKRKSTNPKLQKYILQIIFDLIPCETETELRSILEKEEVNGVMIQKVKKRIHTSGELDLEMLNLGDEVIEASVKKAVKDTLVYVQHTLEKKVRLSEQQATARQTLETRIIHELEWLALCLPDQKIKDILENSELLFDMKVSETLDEMSKNDIAECIFSCKPQLMSKMQQILQYRSAERERLTLLKDMGDHLQKSLEESVGPFLNIQTLDSYRAMKSCLNSNAIPDELADLIPTPPLPSGDLFTTDSWGSVVHHTTLRTLKSILEERRDIMHILRAKLSDLFTWLRSLGGGSESIEDVQELSELLIDSYGM